MAQHLVESTRPFGNTCLGQFFDARRRWISATPHDRLSRLLPSMFLDEAPATDRIGSASQSAGDVSRIEEEIERKGRS